MNVHMRNVMSEPQTEHIGEIAVTRTSSNHSLTGTDQALSQGANAVFATAWLHGSSQLRSVTQRGPLERRLRTAAHGSRTKVNEERPSPGRECPSRMPRDRRCQNKQHKAPAQASRVGERPFTTPVIDCAVGVRRSRPFAHTVEASTPIAGHSARPRVRGHVPRWPPTSRCPPTLQTRVRHSPTSPCPDQRSQAQAYRAGPTESNAVKSLPRQALH
jgi:hypothetical protein